MVLLYHRSLKASDLLIVYKAIGCLTSREGEEGAGIEGLGGSSNLMIGPSVSVSTDEDCYQYHVLVQRQALGSAECIVIGKGRGMEEEEESAVCDDPAQHFAD